MLFNSLEFILFFFVVIHLFYLMNHKYRWGLLLAASCIFYMAFVPVYILILFATIIIDYLAGIFIENAKDKIRRKQFLVISLVANIGVLFFFKYYDFFIENINSVSGQNWTLLNVILPIGLSFHTFQAMSYTIEVYRGNQKAERHFGIYALYVMFYPQLVAGPIERPQNILHQFYIKQKFQYANVVNGLKLMAWGMFKKVVIADRLAVFVDKVFNHPQQYEGISVIVAAVFFSFQIYLDFSGYSDIALGSAQTMGFKLMQNFNCPYLSSSISEFWKRWHISLSSWFKDYLYIPLGGNKVSKFHSYFNQFFVFLVSGFWHGANWTFLLWGALHATYVIIERLIREMGLVVSSSRHIRIIKTVFLFIVITFAWVFFRADTISNATLLITKSFQNVPQQITKLISNQDFERLKVLYLNISGKEFVLSVLLILFILSFEYFQKQKNFVQFVHGFNPVLRWSFYLLLVYGSILLGVFESSQFIYFQF